ncbi:unnamed protein product, partial [Lymnaea stagnalis]
MSSHRLRMRKSVKAIFFRSSPNQFSKPTHFSWSSSRGRVLRDSGLAILLPSTGQSRPTLSARARVAQNKRSFNGLIFVCSPTTLFKVETPEMVQIMLHCVIKLIKTFITSGHLIQPNKLQSF